MNKKISHLYKLAWIMTADAAVKSNAPISQESFLEQFTELVLAECADAILAAETRMCSYYVALIETRFGYPQGHFE